MGTPLRWPAEARLRQTCICARRHHLDVACLLLTVTQPFVAAVIVGSLSGKTKNPASISVSRV
jgi:hypothetical protein